jgi:hypothetical protein
MRKVLNHVHLSLFNDIEVLANSFKIVAGATKDGMFSLGMPLHIKHQNSGLRRGKERCTREGNFDGRKASH